MNKSWIGYAINNWKSAGIELNPGTSIEVIKEAERKIGIQFPGDFKEFYLEMNGFIDRDWTPTMFSIWPIERILEEYNSGDDCIFVGFCDFLINSHLIGFEKGRNGVFKDYETYEPIAPSFADLIYLINSDADIIY